MSAIKFVHEKAGSEILEFWSGRRWRTAEDVYGVAADTRHLSFQDVENDNVQQA